MKDKLLQMRVDEEFLSKLEYLKNINDYKSNSETVTKIIEKEFRKENETTIPQNCYTVSEFLDFDDIVNTVKGTCKCGHLVDRERHNFCPRCGSKLSWSEVLI